MQTPRAIRFLPPELRDQIAAGEVVERPASVVKELVENSLDSGADEIIVQLEDGGQTLISVRDNGFGIARDDLPLAVSSHATSKLVSFDELLHVASYGFRGEALASIASVSELRLTSCRSAEYGGDGQGAFLSVRHGTEQEQGPDAQSCGTLVEVRNLFANVPARLKFMKTNATELKRCQEVLLRIALANEGVEFQLHSGGREIYHFPKRQSLRQRLQAVWPPQSTQLLVPFAGERHGVKVRGLAGLPQAAQNRADRMLFYVNGRAVNDRMLQRAAREAYKGRLISREYPQIVLFVEVDPQELDVNVHPAKTEVRFRNERDVFSAVLHGVRSAVEEASPLAGIGVEVNHEHSSDALFPSLPRANSSDSQIMQDLPGMAEQRDDVARNKESAAGALGTAGKGEGRAKGFWGSLDEPRIIAKRGSGENAYNFRATGEMRESAESYVAYDAGLTRSERGALPAENETHVPSEPARVMEKPEPQKSFAARQSAEEAPAAELPHGLCYLGQVADTYLVVAFGDSMMLLDQHAVHERVLMGRFSREAGFGQSQLLGFPLDISLHPAELDRLQGLWPDLLKLGFGLQINGANLSVSAVPSLFSRAEARDFLRDALADQGGGMHDLLAMMSCKGAIKAGQKLSRDEALALLRQWMAVPDKEYCPHGRPAVLVFSPDELEKMFKRRTS